MLNWVENKSKVVVFKENERKATPTNTVTEHTTLLLCVSASGFFMKPFALLPVKTLNTLDPQAIGFFDYHLGGPDNTWMTGELFQMWMDTYFVPHVQIMRQTINSITPALLILDGHTSRNNLDIARYWNDYQIAILFIPPHTSHFLQPLDVAVNGIFKIQLGKVFKSKRGQSAGERRNRILISTWRALSIALSWHYILCGFENSGIYPTNKSVVENSPYIQEKQASEEPNPKKRKKTPPAYSLNPLTANNWNKLNLDG